MGQFCLPKGPSPVQTRSISQRAFAFALRIMGLKSRSAGCAWSLRPECLSPLPAAQMGRHWVKIGLSSYALLRSIHRALQFKRFDCCPWAAMPKGAEWILPNGRVEGS